MDLARMPESLMKPCVIPICLQYQVRYKASPRGTTAGIALHDTGCDAACATAPDPQFAVALAYLKMKSTEDGNRLLH
jgi:hypothetical protein